MNWSESMGETALVDSPLLQKRKAPKVLMIIRSAIFCLSVVVAMIGAQANACMGVSRTINIKTFNSHMGEAPSGSIGLRHKEVVLTFDDGPNISTTPRVLSALSAECTKATFFIVGEMARAYPKLLQRVARRGHTIAHHTQNHENLTHLSRSEAQRNIRVGVDSVRRALGPYKRSSSKLFRYPYLSRSTSLDKVLRANNLLPLSASVMSQDWKTGSSGDMVNRVMAQLNQTGRGIILLHDIQAKTASALPLLLRRLKRGGYKIVHIRSGGSTIAPQRIASFKSSSKKHRAGKHRKRKNTAVKVARADGSGSLLSLFGFAGNGNEKVDRTTTSSVKRRRAAKKSKRKASKRASARKRRKAKAQGGNFLFPEMTRRKPKESKAQYHARLRARRIKRNKRHTASVSR